MCTSQHYLSFAIVKVEEVIIKPLSTIICLRSSDSIDSMSEMELLLTYRRVSSAYSWILGLKRQPVSYPYQCPEARCS